MRHPIGEPHAACSVVFPDASPPCAEARRPSLRAPQSGDASRLPPTAGTRPIPNNPLASSVQGTDARGPALGDAGIIMSEIDDPSIVERSVEKTHIWLKELERELGVEDRRYAYRALRAVLHALRDRLTVDVAAKLAAQLPTLIRGVYYEDWDPSRTPLPIRDVEQFLDHVVQEGGMSGETEASLAVTAVSRVLREHLSAGEIDDVLAVLPDRLRVLVQA
jgi:uncharacterized protein (DUF2267 family)